MAWALIPLLSTLGSRKHGNCTGNKRRYRSRVRGESYDNLVQQLPTLYQGEVTLVENRKFIGTRKFKVEAVVKTGFLICNKIKVSRETGTIKNIPVRVISLVGANFSYVDVKIKGVVIKQRVAITIIDKKIALLESENSDPSVWMTALQRAKCCAQQAKLADFEKVRTLGRGHFGHVDYVRHRTKLKGWALALKRIRINEDIKSNDIRKSDHTPHFFNERVILEKINYLKNEKSLSLLPRLLFSFKEDNMLYIVSEAFLGGNLLYLMQASGNVSEEIIRHVAAELVAGLISLHEIGIAHRDIKPENIMLDTHGHVKLIDFGLAKQFRLLRSSKKHTGEGSSSSSKKTFPSGSHKESKYARSFSVVGTAYYQPPEMLKGLGHSLSMDWWQIGCLVYELFVGKPAFLASSYQGIKERIIATDTIEIPECVNISPDGQEFVRCLLIREPSDRLGFEEGFIKDHNFLKGFIWDMVEKGNQPAPRSLILTNTDIDEEKKDIIGDDNHEIVIPDDTVNTHMNIGCANNLTCEQSSQKTNKQSLLDLACSYTDHIASF